MARGGSRVSWFVGDGEGCLSLFVLVVSHGVHIVDGGGRLWAVVEFVVVGTRCCGGVSRGARVVAGGRLWAVVVVVVTGW